MNAKKNINWFLSLLVCCIMLMLASSASAGPVVVFDQGHGQQFLVEQDRPLDLSGLATVFSDQGATIKTSATPLTSEVLAQVDILIISGPFAPISNEETAALLSFLDRGGKLGVMAHIHQPLLGLLSQLGVSMSNGAIYEQQHIVGTNPRDFKVLDLKPHPLTSGLESFTVYGGWALLNRETNVQVVAQTSSSAWVDLNKNGILNDRDAMQAFAVILAGQKGKGSFVVFGDDAIFQNQFLQDSNLELAKNLARWLCGEKPSI